MSPKLPVGTTKRTIDAGERVLSDDIEVGVEEVGDLGENASQLMEFTAARR